MGAALPKTMSTQFSRFIARQSPEEIARQFTLLSEGMGVRTGMTLLVYLISAIFAPLWLVLVAATVDLVAERYCLLLMKDLVPARNPGRYVKTLVCVVVVEMAFTVVAVIIFLEDTSFSKAFAVGVLTLTLLQLGSTRAIHRPYAMVGWAGIFVVSLLTVIIYWWGNADVFGFGASLICVLASGYFTFATIRSNHSMHDAMAKGRAEAQSANETKSRFLAQMSHELRTPLNAILGLGHAELAQSQDPESKERLALIVGSARNLAVLLDDILDMSAIQAGHMPIRPKPANPTDELLACLALYRPLFEAAGLDLTIDIAQDIPPLALLDAQRLRQCMSNLLSNALKHTRQGGALVTARLMEPDRLYIEISDTGRGIDPAEADLIFKPFQRRSNTEPGSGLGLSITRALARAMGGDLVLLASDRGARFGFFLTLGQIETETKANTTLHPDNLHQRFAGCRVLVVDDIATNRLVAAAHLQLFGVASDQVASGAEALELIAANPPDLVLLDMNMPDMDGASTLKRIRLLPSRAAKVPVVAMTADSTEAHRENYLGAGMDGLLAKPLTPEGLLAILEQHLPLAGNNLSVRS